MKKRLSIAAIAAAIALCTACAGKPAPAPSSSAPDLSTEPDLLIPYTEQELVLPALQWSGGPQRTDGTNSLWDTRPLAEAKVNLVSVYYRPMDATAKPSPDSGCRRRRCISARWSTPPRTSP